MSDSREREHNHPKALLKPQTETSVDPAAVKKVMTTYQQWSPQ